MVKVKQSFIETYLFGKIMESIKPLNEFRGALDDSEKELKDKVDEIIRELTRIEV